MNEEDKLEDSFKREPRIQQTMNEEPNVFENNISQSSNYEPIPAPEEVVDPAGDDNALDEEGTGTFAAPQTNEVLEQVLMGGTFNAGKQEILQDDDDEVEEEEDERELARIERVFKD